MQRLRDCWLLLIAITSVEAFTPHPLSRATSTSTTGKAARGNQMTMTGGSRLVALEDEYPLLYVTILHMIRIMIVLASFLITLSSSCWTLLFTVAAKEGLT